MSAKESLKNSYIYFGAVLIFEGLCFLLFPHFTTKLLHLSPIETTQTEQYARMAGLGIAVIGYYYVIAGKYTLLAFYKASIIGRLLVVPAGAVLIFTSGIEVPLWTFGVQDLIGTCWSFIYLKAYECEQMPPENQL